MDGAGVVNLFVIVQFSNRESKCPERRRELGVWTLSKDCKKEQKQLYEKLGIQ